MDSLQQEVRQVFAELTRYPIEILDPEVDLEEDLGIDSVKRAEILAAFQERYRLPQELDVPVERLATIGGITEVIRSLRDGVARPEPEAATAPVEPVAVAASSPASSSAARPGPSAAPADLDSRVIDVLAEVTRYPREILTPDADLEEDLGIDSVKLAEVGAVLRERLGLPEVSAEGADPIRTVGDLTAGVANLLEGPASAPVAAPAVAAPEVAAPAAVGIPEEGTRFRAAAPIPGNGGPSAAGGIEAASSSALETASLLRPETRPFAGKLALVTGSGRGIGKAIALHLSRLGAEVVINSFHSRQLGEETAAEIEAAGGSATHLWGSVAKVEHLERVFGEIRDRWGHLDFFVSNAGNGTLAPLDRVTEEHWQKAFRTNVLGLHRGAMLAAPLMRHRGGGRIVTLSSPGARRYIEYFGCLGPIKAAVESLTRYLAIELGGDGIQVNCVSVGPVYGELLSRYPDGDRLIPYWESLSAGNRLGEADDVAAIVAYLLSDLAPRVTGSVLLADSGGSQRI